MDSHTVPKIVFNFWESCGYRHVPQGLFEKTRETQPKNILNADCHSGIRSDPNDTRFATQFVIECQNGLSWFGNRGLQDLDVGRMDYA